MKRIALFSAVLFLTAIGSAHADPLSLNANGFTKPGMTQTPIVVPPTDETYPLPVRQVVCGKMKLPAPVVETVACPQGFVGGQTVTLSTRFSMNRVTGECTIVEDLALSGACTPTTDQAHCFAPAGIPYSDDKTATLLDISAKGALVNTRRGLVFIPCPAQ